jgi:hypothetical protein
MITALIAIGIIAAGFIAFGLVTLCSIHRINGGRDE